MTKPEIGIIASNGSYAEILHARGA